MEMGKLPSVVAFINQPAAVLFQWLAVELVKQSVKFNRLVLTIEL
jgi:hypothetical protein